MKQSTALVLATALAAACSTALHAQWPLHPKPGVPKTVDGKVNVTAQAPRTPEGRPDLSGIWMRTTRAEKPGSAPTGRPPLATFNDAGGGMQGGLPYQPWAAQLTKKRVAEHGLENPDSLCLPQGPLMFHLDPQPKEIIQLPHKTVMIHESNYMIRTIYTDGRKLPPQGEPQPYWHGYSVGRWDGDTLVVDSNNFRGDGWLDFNGSPFTDALRLTERFRRADFGNLLIDFTVDDPKAYARPFTIGVEQVIVADGSELIEYICHENQQFLKMTGRQ